MALWSEERPSEDVHRVLEPDGSLVGDPPDLDDDELRELYWTMKLTRAFEDRALRMQRSGEVSIISRCRGEEATPLGAAAALDPGDWCFPLYRQRSALVYWGVPLDRQLANLMGAEPETVDEHLPFDDRPEPPVNFSPGYIPLGANLPNTVGSALADKLNDRETVSLTFVGDGSTSEGDFHDALNFAGVFEVPAVFVCQNNQWAISVPAHRQTAAETFAQKGDAYGVPNERVDGNDVLAVYQTLKDAVDRARDGGGPTFVECVTYRVVEHNTADEPSVYRDDDLREEWLERDPIDRFEAYLLAEGVLTDDEIESMAADIDEEVQAAVDAAREVPRSEPERMFDNHLRGESWKESHQRAELRRELDGENPFTDWTGEGFE
ncbi:thiamine pyrophosphate-dependent dehydrogenase E1 component subunit alpha [Halobacterium yunchengense]|uniref:thiamine pyrophosphate-dependent dehydrogenase E1 component subunit alpha n=1 Tax=Halobacterium yunchengense TaxID=3108497 RepID=UPI00300A1F1C